VDDYGLQPLEGGFSGETFLGESAGERTVVRIYAGRGARRGVAAVDVDAAVLRLVRGLLPVPEVLELRRPDDSAGIPGILVTGFLPGARLDQLLPRLSQAERGLVGERLGRTLGRMAQMPMPRPGRFVCHDLRIEPWAEDADLVAWVEDHRVTTALADWPDADYDGLLRVADAAQVLLDEVGRACLVHSDVNPKNLLVDPLNHEVTGLLDWEFAHAGHPATDLGNLLRFDRDDRLVEGVLAGYLEVAGHLDGYDAPGARELLLHRARAADLLALVDLAGRRGESPVAERADEQLRAIARTGDLHATAG